MSDTTVRWLTSRPPRLERPLLLAAFASNHTGSTAAALLGTLREQIRLEPLAEIDPDSFYDFTVARPLVLLDEDGGRRLAWPENRFELLRAGGRDIVIFNGLEPHLRWKHFAAAFHEVAGALGVSRTVFLGTHPGPVPHTRVPQPHLYGDDEEIARLLAVTAEPSTYQGPASINTLLSLGERALGRGGALLMAPTPFYVAVDPNPYGALALADALTRRLEIPLDLEPVRAMAQPLDEQLRLGLARSEAFRELVAHLEAELERRSPLAPVDRRELEPLLAEIEAYLGHERRSSGGPGGPEGPGIRGPAGV